MSTKRKPAVSLALAAGISALCLSLLACATAPSPQPPAPKAYSVHVKRGQAAAAVLTPDAREWCSSFSYREGSTAFDNCVARWQRSESYEVQKQRAAGAGP